MNWLNAIVQGALLGGYYALLACGLSFMFGVMRIVNLAHGTLAVVAAYGVVHLADRHGLSPWWGLALAVPAMAGVGALLQWLMLERSRRAGELVPILATFGLAVALDNAMFSAFGADARSLAPSIDTLAYDSVELGGLMLGQLPLLVFGTALALLGGLHLLLAHSAIGRRIRAVSEDPATAQLVGVNATAVNLVAAAIAMGAVAIAGTFLAMRATVDPYAGAPQLLFAFEAVMIGGAGSLWGTLAGGVALGITQSLGAQVHTQGFLIAGHVLFLVVLLARIAFKK